MNTMMKRAIFCCVCVISILIGGEARSATLAESVTEFRLDNGMRWLLVRRTQAPVFSGVVMVRAGGVDEQEGKAGLAHMLEHMAFKGSKVIGTRNWRAEKPLLEDIAQRGRELTGELTGAQPDQQRINKLKAELEELKSKHAQYYKRNEIWELMSRNGARDLNAFTSKDVTAYHASMPINRVGLWSAIFSEMLIDPVFREFYIERDVIAEERRTGIDNHPDGKMAEVLLRKAFQHGPFAWSTIGPPEDIQRYLLEDALAFQRAHYVPQRMVGVIVGDIDIDETKHMVKKYFGRMPRGEKPPSQPSPSNRGGGSTTFYFKAEPSIAMAFHKPTLPDPEEYVFDVVTTLLCDGPTSRLYRRLVIEEKVARRVSCSDAFPGSRMPNLMIIWVEPLNGARLQRVEKLIDEELDKLKRVPVRNDELKTVRKKVAAAFLFGLETNSGLAMELAQFETIFDEWRLLISYPQRVAAVSAEDIQKLAKKYFTNENRTLVKRLRPSSGEASR